MYKFLSGILAILLLIGGAVYGYERWQHGKQRRELNNKLAKVQKMQQETETAHSRLAIEAEDLKAENSDLQDIIEDRDEAILALTHANIKLKNKVVRIEDAKQSTVDRDGNVVEHPGCEEVGDSLRTKVAFEKEEDPLKISGFTLTNPAYAEVEIKWLRDIKLEVVLTKNDDGTYRVYLDSTKSDIVPTDLQLQVDPSILEYKWYQKIGFGSNVVGGETGIQLGLSAFYDILPNLYLGPMFQVGYVNGKAETYYGAVVGWYPWK